MIVLFKMNLTLTWFLFMISCTVAKLDLDILKKEEFTLPGGCMGMELKNSNDEELKSATYTNNNGCEAYFTSRYVILLYIY